MLCAGMDADAGMLGCSDPLPAGHTIVLMYVSIYDDMMIERKTMHGCTTLSR